MPDKTSLPNVDQIPKLQAGTQLRATGTWLDSNAAESETRIDNVVLEFEYGEVEAERIGDGVITALRLINNLEINEELLYGRMEKIEQSTLVP